MSETQVARAGSFDDIPIYALADGSRGDFDKYYVHEQSAPSAVWEWEHGMGKNPSVTVVGSDGAIWEPDISYPVDNVSVRAEFGGAMSGSAFNS